MIVANALRLPYGDLSAHAAVTSPPYYQKRRYEGVEPSPWPEVSYSPMPGLPAIDVPAARWKAEPLHDPSERLCPVWLDDSQEAGILGLEPDPFAYIAHLVLVAREVKRVLRDDGVFAVNIGDSYNQGASNQHAGLSDADRYKERPPVKVKRRSKLIPQKCLLGIPWRLAFALIADGWTLRSRMPGGVEMRPDVIWTKNAMPESVRDRPSVDFEDVFIFSKGKRYFWDQENGRTEVSPGSLSRWPGGTGRQATSTQGANVTSGTGSNSAGVNPSGANMRASWKINTEPTSAKHYAAFPRELARRLIKIGTSDKGCCPECGAQWVRLVERERTLDGEALAMDDSRLKNRDGVNSWSDGRGHPIGAQGVGHWRFAQRTRDLGWAPGCSCGENFVEEGVEDPSYLDSVKPPEPVPCRVLDPFSGIGRTGEVCFETGRIYMPAELSVGYAAIQARRLEERRPGLEVERQKAEAAAVGQVLGAGKLAEISGPLFAQEDS